MKKGFLILSLFIFTHFLFSQDLILLREFDINGIKETKKVKMIEHNEYNENGDPVMYSKNGKVKFLFFYEDGLLVKQWESVSSYDDGLYWYQFNSDTNLFDLKFSEAYKETLYFYDDEKRLIREEVTDTESYLNYFYDEEGNLIKQEADWGSLEYKNDTKKRTLHVKADDGSEFFYKYDKKKRYTYKKEVYQGKYIYEYFYKYDDKKHTKTTRWTKKHEGKLVFDFTDFDQYDSEGNLIYSKFYSGIITDSSDKLLGSELKEQSYVYNLKGYPIHEKTISSEKETNKYYEYIFDENEPLRTSICFEEVE